MTRRVDGYPFGHGLAPDDPGCWGPGLPRQVTACAAHLADLARADVAVREEKRAPAPLRQAATERLAAFRAVAKGRLTTARGV